MEYREDRLIDLLIAENALLLTKTLKKEGGKECWYDWTKDGFPTDSGFPNTVEKIQAFLSVESQNIGYKPHKIGLLGVDYDGGSYEHMTRIQQHLGPWDVVLPSGRPCRAHFLVAAAPEVAAKAAARGANNPLGYKGEIKYDKGYLVLHNKGDNYERLYQYLIGRDKASAARGSNKFIDELISVTTSPKQSKTPHKSLVSRPRLISDTRDKPALTANEIIKANPGCPEVGDRHNSFIAEMLKARRYPELLSLEQVAKRALESGLPKAEVDAMLAWVKSLNKTTFRIVLPHAPSQISIPEQCLLFLEYENHIPIFDFARQKLFFKRRSEDGSEHLRLTPDKRHLLEGSKGYMANLRLDRLNFKYMQPITTHSKKGGATTELSLINRSKQDWDEVERIIKCDPAHYGSVYLKHIENDTHVDITSAEAAWTFLQRHLLTHLLKVEGFHEGGEPESGVCEGYKKYIWRVSAQLPMAMYARQKHPYIACKIHTTLIAKEANTGKGDYKYLLDDIMRPIYFQERVNLKPSQFTKESDIFSNMGGRALGEVNEVLNNISKGEQSENFKSMTDINSFSCSLKFAPSDGITLPSTIAMYFSSNDKPDRYLMPDDRVAAHRLLPVPCLPRIYDVSGSPIKRIMDSGHRIKMHASMHLAHQDLMSQGGRSKVEEYISTLGDPSNIETANQTKLITRYSKKDKDADGELMLYALARGDFAYTNKREWGGLAEFFSLNQDTRKIKQNRQKDVMAYCGYKEVRCNGQRVWRVDQLSTQCKLLQLRKIINPNLYKTSIAYSVFDPNKPSFRILG